MELNSDAESVFVHAETDEFIHLATSRLGVVANTWNSGNDAVRRVALSLPFPRKEDVRDEKDETGDDLPRIYLDQTLVRRRNEAFIDSTKDAIGIDETVDVDVFGDDY